MTRAEQQRRGNKRDRLLQYLQFRQEAGATNQELLNVAGFRYGARIFELRKVGWIIETIHLTEGSFRFVLKGRVQDQANLFGEAKCHTGVYPD